KRLLLLFVTMKFSVWPASSVASGGGEPGYGRMFVAQLAMDCAGSSSRTVWSAPLVKLGTSLTAVAVMMNVCGAEVSTPPLAVPPSSLATMVTVAVPLAFGASVYVSVPVTPSMAGSAEKNEAFVL